MSKSTVASKTCLIAFCFFSFGLWYSFVQFVLISATEDILSGTLLSSTTVLIYYSIPDVTAKILSPFIVRKISFLASFILLVIFMSLALLLLVVIENPYYRLLGANLSGFGNGFGTILFARMLPYYDDIEKNVSYFQMGGNCSSMIASLFYTGLTTWLCVAPRTTIASCIPTVLLLPFFYAIIDKEPFKVKEQEKNTRMDNVHYAPVSTTDDEQVSNTMRDKIFRKILFFFKVFPYLSYFGLSFFSTYLSMNSVVTTLIFPSAPFLPRDHYQYYRLLSDLGTFLGGTEILFVSMFCSDWQSFFKVRRIWILVLLNAGHLLFFLHASWYHFVSNVAVILVLCFTQGFIHGSTAVHCLASCTECFTSTSDKGTAIGLVEVGSSTGRLLSGLLGLFVETYLREHCTNRLLLGRMSCLTRFGSISAWSENRLDCKL